MLRVLWKTVLGFLIIALGFYFAFHFIQQEGNAVYLGLLVFPIMFLGGYLIKKGADASEENRKSKLKLSETIGGNDSYENKLSSNEKLSNDWERTDQLRIKLKTMKFAANEAEKKSIS